MTSGIYQLNFGNQAYYVGQSQNMEVRWKQHADKFRKHKAAEKMQEAYNRYGMPVAGILIKCHKDYLDTLENYYIAIQKQYPNCLNTSAPPPDPNVNYQWLIDNPYILEYSAINMMGTVVMIREREMKLKEEHEQLKQSFDNKYMLHKAAVELRDGKDQNAVLLQRAQQKVDRLMNRGLYDRVFNHQ